MRDNLHGLIALSLWLLLFASVTAANAQSVERQIVVSVVDSDGAPVTDLTPTDIVVTEDGARREVLSVQRDPEPKQIALLVDTSHAAGPAVRDFKKAASAFVEAMGEEHELSIISFGGTPRILTEATDDLSQLRDGVDKIFSYSNTASYLLDAVTETVRGFQRRSTPRPIVVVLATLGVDHSNANDLATLDRLKEAGAALHTIVLAQSPSGRTDTGRIWQSGGVPQRPDQGRVPEQSFERDPFSTDNVERNRFLDQGPTQTGGRRRYLQTFSSAERAVNDLAVQLRSQYLVVYSRPGMLIPPERIQVAVNRDGLDTRGTPVAIESDP